MWIITRGNKSRILNLWANAASADSRRLKFRGHWLFVLFVSGVCGSGCYMTDLFININDRRLICLRKWPSGGPTSSKHCQTFGLLGGRPIKMSGAYVCFICFGFSWLQVFLDRCLFFFAKISGHRFIFYTMTLRGTKILKKTVFLMSWEHFGRPWGLQGGQKRRSWAPRLPKWNQNGSKIGPKTVPNSMWYFVTFFEHFGMHFGCQNEYNFVTFFKICEEKSEICGHVIFDSPSMFELNFWGSNGVKFQ